MDLWRWAPVPSDLPIPAGSSTSVNVLSDRQQLAVTCHVNNVVKKTQDFVSKENFDNASHDSLKLMVILLDWIFIRCYKILKNFVPVSLTVYTERLIYFRNHSDAN